MATTTLAANFNFSIPGPQVVAAERILVIGNNRGMQRILQRFLSSQGYEVEVVAEHAAAMERLHQALFSAVILDLQQPGSSGYEVCSRIASLNSGRPLVVLNASPDVADKVLLLETGADDYITIPFSPRELLARLRALMRRTLRVSIGTVYFYDDVIVNFSKMEVKCGGEKIKMTVKEFHTLEYLIKNAERVISRDELLKKVWGYNHCPSTRTVDTHILKLRQKLESDPSSPLHIITVHSVGYKFIP